MTTKADFLTTEWKQLVNAPHVIYRALVKKDGEGLISRRKEAKALDKFLGDYEPTTNLVQDIMKGQGDADDVSGSYKNAIKALREVGTLIDTKATEKEEAAIRGFLLDAAEEIADAVTEEAKLIGKANPQSKKEQQAIAEIEKALNPQGRSSLRGTIKNKGIFPWSKSKPAETEAPEAPIVGPTSSDEELQARIEARRQAVAKRKAAAKKSPASSPRSASSDDALQARIEARRKAASQRRAKAAGSSSSTEEVAGSSDAELQARIEARRKAVEDRRAQAGQLGEEAQVAAQKRAVEERAAERRARKEAEQKTREANETRQRAKAQAEAEKRRKEAIARREAAAKRREDAETKQKSDIEKRRAAAAKRREEIASRRQAKPAGASASPGVQAPPAKPATPAPAATAEQTYVVKPGDTLSHVSLHFYGTAHRWKDIFEANRDVLRNPNLIIPGQTLKIPA